MSQQQLVVRQLTARYLPDTPVSQPLLLPVSAKPSKITDVAAFCTNAAKLGMEVQSFSNKLILKQVPIGARKQRWQDIFVALLECEAVSMEAIIDTIARFWELDPGTQAVALTEILEASEAGQDLRALGAISVPLDAWLGQFDE